MDLDGDGRLDHIIVYAPMNLSGDAQRAIRTLKRTWTKGYAGDLQLALAAAGDRNDLRALPAQLGRSVNGLLGPPEGARVWISATPFVPPRFLKRRGSNSLEGQINAELASRVYPHVARFDVLPIDSAGMLPFRHYIRRRQHGGAPPPVDVGYRLRLEFSEPVAGPILLGYASHFGLGMFLADTSAAEPILQTSARENSPCLETGG